MFRGGWVISQDGPLEPTILDAAALRFDPNPAILYYHPSL